MRIAKVKYLHDYQLEVTFNDGKIKVADFRDFVHNSLNPMVTQFKDKGKFKTVRVDHGHLTWDDEMDISADSIYKGNYNIKS